MKYLVLTISLALLATPCAAGPVFDHGQYLLVASADRGQGQGQPGGKVVIKGKGGKVTDVKKPKKGGKKSK